LKDSAPPVLFYAGEKALLGQPGIAVVGSRHLDEAGQECAKFVGNACGISGQVLYSGGAKGVDTISMETALEARGTAVGVLADSLEKAIRSRETALRRGDLCLVTPYSPNAGFSWLRTRPARRSVNPASSFPLSGQSLPFCKVG
jgi:predicted Rossmann fold nucleotide-binding protein DprA/Smf involved in DNA uptake